MNITTIAGNPHNATIQTVPHILQAKHNGRVHDMLPYIALGSCISVVGTLSNFLFILLLLKERRLWTVSNCLLGHLAVVDMLVCCLTIPWNLRLTAGTSSLVSCQMGARLFFFFPHLSMQAQCLISCNRCFLMTRAKYVYNKWFSKGRVMTYVAVGLIVAITIVVLVASFAEKTVDIQTTAHCDLNSNVTGTRRLQNYILCLLSVIYFTIGVGFYGKLIRFVRQNSFRLNLAKKRESKTSVTLFFLLCVYFITFLASPLALYIHSLLKDDTSKTHFDQVLFCLVMMNYAVNPVVYGFRIEDFKEAMKNICRRSSSRVHPTNGTSAFQRTRRIDVRRRSSLHTQQTIRSIS